MKGLIAQLALVKANIEEEDAVAVLLKTVAKSYSNLVTKLKIVLDLTLKVVISSLLDEEKRNKPIAHTSTSPREQAFYTKNAPMKCSFCKKKGHIEARCYIKYPQKKRCGQCEELGHLDRECNNKMEDNNLVRTVAPNDQLF